MLMPTSKLVCSSSIVDLWNMLSLHVLRALLRVQAISAPGCCTVIRLLLDYTDPDVRQIEFTLYRTFLFTVRASLVCCSNKRVVTLLIMWW